jgi:hypothetical protein
MTNYIANRSIGVDEETGLSIELRVKELTINADIRLITVKVIKCLVSPSGVEMKIIETLYYNRADKENNMKYSMLESSPIGQGIRQMLLTDLAEYPNLTQEG